MSNKSERRRQKAELGKAIALLCVLCVLCGGTLRAGRLPLASLNFTQNSANVVTCGSGTSLDDLDPLTICAWIRPTALGADDFIFSKGNNLQFYFDASGFLEAIVRLSTTDALYSTTTDAMAVNNWYFVCMTFNSANGNGQRIKFFRSAANFNGAPVQPTVSVGVEGAGTRDSDAADNAEIGALTVAGSLSMGGQIDRAIYWRKEFTLNDVRLLEKRPQCQGGATGDTCRGYWPLGWSAAGTGTQPDLSGNGNNCTVTGATLASPAPIARYP